jgi:hypothetical protein
MGDGQPIMPGGSLGVRHIHLSAHGQRLRLFRDVGSVTMDTDGVERVDVNALGGADTITVNDLTELMPFACASCYRQWKRRVVASFLRRCSDAPR